MDKKRKLEQEQSQPQQEGRVIGHDPVDKNHDNTQGDDHNCDDDNDKNENSGNNKKARIGKQEKSSKPPFNKNKSWKERNKEREQVHPGSYACAEMRTLFDISLPELDESTTESASFTATNNNNNNNNTEDDLASSTAENNNSKLPKRKVALLLQFVGTNYSGMQINEGKRTIQAEIELALYKAGMLTKPNFGYPKKYSWSNSARTDKGVHACAQVCSVKILLPSGNLDMVREMINEQLPDDISVGDVVQVPRSFCARTQRDKVGYLYMLPSYVLKSREEWKSVWEKIVGVQNDGDGEMKRSEMEPQEDNDEMNAPSGGRCVMTNEQIESLRETMRGYRMTQETLDRLKKALGSYEGTHKFHNYTRGKKWDDPSSSRYIISFEVQEPLVDKHGIEWIPTVVVGQSFLLHQIRKMMCMAMDVARGATSLDFMTRSFGDVSMNINTAPAQGLSLDMSFYEYFNKRSSAGEPLDWHSDQTSPAHLRWKKFKEEKVMKHIMEEEWTHGNFLSYMHLQETHIQRGNYEL
mmetsp:Transcript_13959/g.26266  ORF Transcript_13959/g.26266 Transcript_13959/m.26266 type:complete len:524 (+) Transcript_13959:330-1901(+)